MFMNVSVLPSQDLWVLSFNRIYETGFQLKSDWISSYILRRQTMQYPTVNNNADLEFLSTPQCKVIKSHSKWVMFLLRVYNAIKPVTSFCQVFKVEICKANTTVTWQVVIPQLIPRNIRVPRLFYARILLFMAVFGHFFFASKSCESFWEILRDSKFQNSKVILVRFRAFMTETFERHRSNQNRNTNWNEQKIWGFES